MPIYEYECANCEERFEVFQGINDQPAKKCIHCKSLKIKKLISNCSFQLKGTGWYVTDYARKDQENNKKAKEPKDSAASEKKDSAKTSDTTSPQKTEKGKAA